MRVQDDELLRAHAWPSEFPVGSRHLLDLSKLLLVDPGLRRDTLHLGTSR